MCGHSMRPKVELTQDSESVMQQQGMIMLYEMSGSAMPSLT